MRILYLTHLYLPSLGGVQRSVHTLARGLRERGHEIGIVCHGPGGTGPADPAVLRLRIPDPFRRGPVVGLRRRHLDRRNHTELLRWARARRIDLVHAHLINIDTRYARPLADALGVPMVVTLRGGETEHWLRAHPARERYIRRTLGDADYVTALSPSLLDMAMELEPAIAGHSEVIPNPCDPDAIRRRIGADPLPGEPDRPFVAFVGRLAPMKDVGSLIDAFHQLHEREPPSTLSLAVVGDGQLRGELEAQAARGPASQRIRFLGATDRDAALGLIHRAAALVLPSVASEGCPNVILEAFAVGTPVLASDLPAAAHMIDQGAAGGLFPRRDPSRLATLLGDLDAGRLPLDRWRSAGHRLLVERHEPGRIFRRYESLYTRLRESPGPSNDVPT